MLLGRRLCEPCTLADRLTDLLDDGTDQVHPLPAPLMELDRPKSRLIRLRRPNVLRLLQDLASGRVPITHEGLQQQEHWRTANHVPDLLMESSVLPQVDRRLLLYERRLAERLATVQEPDRHQLLHRFATWHQLRRLRTEDSARTGDT
ncbi:hypothetical protein QZH56_36260 [Streptomyces olivoreticuli]|uniref:hypothetical protein n=1 Tax=Streptomyces olivoreticuli TaxID=68246 RepID=UPI00265AC247|nr:hypothetical protein [Streptomyces olivoreticuli]WKK24059.1 hypothetical protein QZH56_36260 [Streptomyces olivoreticuli]